MRPDKQTMARNIFARALSVDRKVAEHLVRNVAADLLEQITSEPDPWEASRLVEAVLRPQANVQPPEVEAYEEVREVVRPEVYPAEDM